MWFVTSGAVSIPIDQVSRELQAADPCQALAWGFAITAAEELPLFRVSVVDAGPLVTGAQLLHELTVPGVAENQVVLRVGGRFVPRLAAPPRVYGQGSFAWAPKASGDSRRGH